MASSGALNLKTKLESLVRLNVPVAAGETIVESEWFTRNASGEAIKTTTPVNIAYVTFAGTDRPDSRDTQDDPIGGLGTPVEISTGVPNLRQNSVSCWTGSGTKCGHRQSSHQNRRSGGDG